MDTRTDDILDNEMVSGRVILPLNYNLLIFLVILEVIISCVIFYFKDAFVKILLHSEYALTFAVALSFKKYLRRYFPPENLSIMNWFLFLIVLSYVDIYIRQWGLAYLKGHEGMHVLATPILAFSLLCASGLFITALKLGKSLRSVNEKNNRTIQLLGVYLQYIFPLATVILACLSFLLHMKKTDLFGLYFGATISSIPMLMVAVIYYKAAQLAKNRAET